ncbi:MAG: hypothetical protein IJ870_01470 [Alphaproteobacteria bacterium]|nr:hypothetical protein [Alphaproteobacteria bacterium]
MDFGSLRDLKLKGFAKFLHQCFMFVSYPLRHPLKFFLGLLLIVAVLVVLPLLDGKDFSQIPSWYAAKWNKTLKQETVLKETPIAEAKQKPQKFAKQITLKHAKVEPQKVEVKIKEPEEEPQKYAVWNIQKVPSIKPERLEEFEELEEVKEPDLQVEKIPVVQEEIIEQEKEIIEQKTESVPQVAYRKVENLKLKYMDNPQIIFGTPIIYGPNELYVADTYLYLYGIYTDPYKYNIKKATAYLNELISGAEIECHIVAKTLDDIATAVCLKNGRSINQNLVDAGLADNVAL